MGGEKSLKEVLDQVVELEAAKVAARPTAILPDVRVAATRVGPLALSGQTINRRVTGKPTTTQKRVKAVENWGPIPSLHTRCVGKGKYDSLIGRA